LRPVARHRRTHTPTNAKQYPTNGHSVSDFPADLFYPHVPFRLVGAPGAALQGVRAVCPPEGPNRMSCPSTRLPNCCHARKRLRIKGGRTEQVEGGPVAYFRAAMGAFRRGRAVVRGLEKEIESLYGPVSFAVGRRSSPNPIVLPLTRQFAARSVICPSSPRQSHRSRVMSVFAESCI
jgi:hypothetical protein